MPKVTPTVELALRLVSPDRRVALEAQRQVLAEQLASPGVLTSLSMMASASKEMRAICGELAAMSVPEVSKLDELKERRAARRADSADSPSAARRSQPRRGNGRIRTS